MARQSSAYVPYSTYVPPSLVPKLDALIAAITGFADKASLREEHFPEAEMAFSACVADLETTGLAEMLSELDEDAPRIQIGENQYRRLEPPNYETYAGIRGEARVLRHIYRLVGIHNGPTVVPLELRAGMVEGRFTPAAAIGLAHMNEAMPSREADEVARSLGVLPYSRSAQHRGGTAMGAKWAEMEETTASELLKVMKIPEEAYSIALGIDRVSMPMAEERPITQEDVKKGVKKPIAVQFRMAYVGVWTLCDGQGRALSCVRYGHIPEGGADAMVQRLRADLAAVKEQRADLQVCTLGDGAPEIQALLDRVVAGYIVSAQMVDFWHFAEYLGSAISSAKKDPSLLDRFRVFLTEWDSGVEIVEAKLEEWARAGPSDGKATAPESSIPTSNPEGELGEDLSSKTPEAIHNALRYIRNHRERLRYASAYHAGLPIGSGHVEATAKTIFETRIKRTGCRWKPAGGQALISLRALATSNSERWNLAMEKIIESCRTPYQRIGISV